MSLQNSALLIWHSDQCVCYTFLDTKALFNIIQNNGGIYHTTAVFSQFEDLIEYVYGFTRLAIINFGHQFVESYECAGATYTC